MSENDFQELWNYYLILGDDLDNTSNFVEPKGQENTFSFEFDKLLTLLFCTEVESVLKLICKAINSNRNPKVKIICDSD